MDKFLDAIKSYFAWLIAFLANFGVKVPEYVEDMFTTTEATTEEAAE